MKTPKNRRNFLKIAGLMAGFSQLPFAGWPAGFATLLSEGINPLGEFSLLKLEKLLTGYQFPIIQRFSTSAFHSKYRLFNLYGNNATFAGEFSLKSELKGNNRLFDFSHGRSANAGIKNSSQGFKYLIIGKFQCKNDSTISPEKWRVSTRIARMEEGSAFGDTGIILTGEAKNGSVILKSIGKPVEKFYGSHALSWKFGLPAVVQNMAESSVRELRFSALDEFDAIYQNQTLIYRKKVSLVCGNNRKVDFGVFELTGDGVIPTVFWVDDMNRTVFVVTGMEAFVLDNTII